MFILTSSPTLGYGPQCLKLSTGSLPYMVPNAEIWMFYNNKFTHNGRRPITIAHIEALAIINSWYSRW